MARNRRQKQSMKEIVDLYAPNPPSTTGDLREVVELTYPTTPTYTNVYAGFHAMPGYSSPQIMGRTQEDIMFTLDKFFFDVAQDIDDTWLIEIRTPGSILKGFFWFVMGDPKIHEDRGRRRANYLEVFGRRNPRPSYIAERP